MYRTTERDLRAREVGKENLKIEIDMENTQGKVARDMDQTGID